ncbi:hypothetical protein V8E36_002174 [Tilletia maclaganii]
MGASTKDKRDIYYRKGKAELYRARSAYKLIHLDEVFGFLQPLAGVHSYSARFGDVAAGRLPPRRRRSKRTSSGGGGEGERSHAPEEQRGEGEEKRDAAQGPAEEKGRTIIDLCAAPGSWSQVLARTLSGGSGSGSTSSSTPGAPPPPTLIAVDLQQMAPIPSVHQLTADITLPTTASHLRAFLPSSTSTSPSDNLYADLIICDGAPDIHGLHILDEFLHAFLLRAALSIVLRMLRPGGMYIAKIFTHDSRPIVSVPPSAASGGGTGGAPEDRIRRSVFLPFRARETAALNPAGARDEPTYSASTLLRHQLETLFERVHILKPTSSRASSAEHFVVCENFLRQSAAERAGLEEGEEEEGSPLASTLWDTVQGRDALAACLLAGSALPPVSPAAGQEEGQAGDQLEARRRRLLHSLIRFAAEGDLCRA